MGEPIRVYAYANCDTCRKALRFLKERDVAHQVIPIREQPPTRMELRQMLAAVGEVKRLFNTSGQDYRAQGLGAKLPEMKAEEALELLAANGNLVKRPFVIGKGIHLVGFQEETWKAALG